MSEHPHPSADVLVPFCLRVPEAAQALGVGRTRLYELIANGSVDSFCEGRRRLVVTSSIKAYIDRRTSESKPKIEAAA